MAKYKIDNDEDVVNEVREAYPLYERTDENWKNKVFSHPEATVRLATCFSGIGAIEHAFKRLKLKHEIVFAGDIDDKCKKSYFANYDMDESRWHSDTHDFNAKPYLGQVDLLVGGAPCQAFSMVGKRLGFEDTRGTLFYEFARVIKECQPKLFLFENVKGITSHDKGRTWATIKNVFAEQQAKKTTTNLSLR